MRSLCSCSQRAHSRWVAAIRPVLARRPSATSLRKRRTKRRPCVSAMPRSALTSSIILETASGRAHLRVATDSATERKTARAVRKIAVNAPRNVVMDSAMERKTAAPARKIAANARLRAAMARASHCSWRTASRVRKTAPAARSAACPFQAYVLRLPAATPAAMTGPVRPRSVHPVGCRERHSCPN